MFIKKEDNKYFISGGLTWIPLPTKIKTRKDVEDLLTHGNNPREPIVYADDNFKPATRFDVFWRNDYPMAREDENTKTYFVLDLPKFATDQQIIDRLRQRAKTLFNKEAVIHFTQERPEPPAED